MVKTTIKIILTLSLFISNFAQELKEATVKVNKLNVRAFPNVNAIILCQIKKDDKVKIISIQEEWVKIQAPLHSSAWVFSDFIREGKLIADSIYVRSGPSIAYSAIGKLPVDTKIKVLSTYDKWSKIQPLPEFLSAWVYHKYLQKEEKELKPKQALTQGQKKIIEKEVKKTPQIEEATFDEPETEAKKRQQEKLDFITDTGYLIEISKNHPFVDYVLAKKQGGEFFPIYYLSGFKDELVDYIDKKVKISGVVRFIKGWKHPIVYINNFEVITE